MWVVNDSPFTTHYSRLTFHASPTKCRIFAPMQYTLKKSLGQHFLKDEHICKKIVDALKEDGFERLVEVGPGGGALTKYLLALPGINFRAVELDDEKVQFLQQTFPAITGRLIHKDFLHWIYQPPQNNNPGFRSGYGIKLTMIDRN